MKEINILHYVGRMDIGGMESMIMSLYRNIDKSQYQFSFAVHTEKEGYFDVEIRELGGQIYSFPPMRKNPTAYRKKWATFWKEHNRDIDVFQMHTNSLANCIALQEAKKAGVKIRIVHAHSAYADKGRLQLINDLLHKYHRSRIKKYATNLIACSPEAATWLFGSKNSRNAVMLNNGISYNQFQFCPEWRSNIRNEINAGDKIVICQIGHLLNVKNYAFMIKVMEELKKQTSKFIYLIVGDGPLRNQIQEEVKSCGLKDQVIFLGARGDIPQILAGSDIYVMPSLYEGLPLAAIEAQVSGLPCLLSDSIGNSCKVSNRLEFLKLNCIDAWKETLISIMNRRAELLDRNIEVDDRFEIQKTVRQYIEVIESAKRN